ncbi:Putative conserved hypothetical protein [Candidatus Fokinia solitaria]|uniref:DUF3857 domain-containing protein n=1 Tax=Candidatus Fokinia solitaria TaxID=1802984 RepID=A0A2U8BS35_9RICK|nr:DUF3857 domain-containing protein [Candidatus Fokinia solitaria]AWD33151.1 Putative conserved hypothetical protein [Candidatus Fokinia solitaria]
MESRFFSYILSAILYLTLLSNVAYARWESVEDVHVKCKLWNVDIHVAADGKAEVQTTEEYEIVNERARKEYGTYTLLYGENSSKIEILEAKVINGKESYEVSKDSIEIKPLASSTIGFDDVIQVIVSFPNVKVGSKLFLKYKKSIFKPVHLNHYINSLFLGSVYTEKFKMNLHSEIPLRFSVNDPDNYFAIKSDLDEKSKRAKNITLTLKKPVIIRVTEENDSYISIENYPAAFFSSFENSQEFGNSFTPRFEGVISEELPPLLQEIKTQAMKCTDIITKLNVITSLLNEKVRYMGDWREVEGKVFPRSLKKVADTGVADCKEFSSCVAAILRKMGMEVNVALVHRGKIYQSGSSSGGEALMYECNHAIVRVKEGGKVYWIDPTNFISMADGIFSDISGRGAIVLKEGGAIVDNIPEVDYTHAVTKIESKVELLNKEKREVHEEGKIEVCGENAIPFTGAELLYPRNAIERALFYIIVEGVGETTDYSSLKKKAIHIPSLTSRNVKTIPIKYSYIIPNAYSITNMGFGASIQWSEFEQYISVFDDRVSSLFVHSPYSIFSKKLFLNMSAENLQILNFQITSPWLIAKQSVKSNGKDLEIQRELHVLRKIITPKEMHSKSFRDMQEELRKHAEVVLIFNAKQ